MDLDAYVAEHAGEWLRLESLSRARKLGPDEADELVALYQRAATHLSVVRSRSPDPALVARLSRLVLIARGAMTGSRRFSWAMVGTFVTETFPLAVYRMWRWWTSVGVLFTAVSLVLIYYIATHLEVAALFMTQGQMDDLANHDFASYYSEFQPQNFALQVWTNNALVTAQCLAAGVLILPALYVLFENAFGLGLDGGVMVAYGHSTQFYSLILPHGLLELTCVYIAGGAGLRIGWAWIAPGPLRTRTQALAQSAREGMVVALGLVGVLFVSGLLEAFVTPAPVPPMLRVLVGALVWLSFLAYVVIRGRKADLAGRTVDLTDEFTGATAPTA